MSITDKISDIALDAGMTLVEFEKMIRENFLKRALARHQGNQSRAARSIGIHRNTITRIMDELGLVRRQKGRSRYKSISQQRKEIGRVVSCAPTFKRESEN